MTILFIGYGNGEANQMVKGAKGFALKGGLFNLIIQIEVINFVWFLDLNLIH